MKPADTDFPCRSITLVSGPIQGSTSSFVPAAAILPPHIASAETVELKQGEFKLINLGVAMQLPDGYEAHIVPRSSTYKNFGIIQANHCGIVDESYCGPNDWFYMPVIAMRDTKIEKGDRICQFRIFEHQPEIVFDEVDKLEGKDRGGIGSTGVK